ncbi:MAG: hypothetical protein SGI77_01845 [Pirellulaceae bacterium]|nr:hypothetical protein [Pirellulaceae bacterium]
MSDTETQTVKKQNSVIIQRLWWLQPAWLFAFVVGVTMTLAVLQSDRSYLLYNTPKYINATHGLMALGAIIVFAIGCNLAEVTGRKSEPIDRVAIPLLTSSLKFLFALTTFGYFVWLLVAIKNGFSISMLREVLFGDDAGAVYELATDVFANISGVTTCTQFAMAAVPLGVWLFATGYRNAIWFVGIIIAIAFARAFMLSERLSLVELVVPAGVIIVRQYFLNQRISSWAAWGLRGAPLFGVIVLMVFFGSAEYLRSWKLYQKDFDSIASFTVWRISGYYTTALNNGAMALETKANYALPYYTIQSLWAFPGVSTSPLGYKNLTGVNPENQHLYMLERFGTEELNNFGGLFGPALDYGTLGFLVFWFGSGFVSGRLHRSFLVGSLAGIMLYPLFFLAILEVPRILYLPNQRIFPSLVAIAAIVWLAYRQTRLSNATRGVPASKLQASR